MLRSDAFDHQAFSLSGPESLSYAEAAAVISRQVDDSQFLQSLTEAGLPADYAQFLAVLFGFVRQGAASQVADSVKLLTGRDPGTLEEYAARHADFWR